MKIKQVCTYVCVFCLVVGGTISKQTHTHTQSREYLACLYVCCMRRCFFVNKTLLNRHQKGFVAPKPLLAISYRQSVKKTNYY